MPIDPNIPLAGKAALINSPAQTLGQVYAMRNQQLQGQRLKQENDALDLENQARTRAAGDDAAMRSAFSQYASDPDQAVDHLFKSGNAGAAMKAQGLILAHRKESASTAKQQLDATKAAFDVQSSLLEGAKDEASYQMVRGVMKKLVPPEQADAIDKILPPNYDPAAVENAKSMLTDKAHQLTAHKNSVEEAQWALTHGMPDKDGNYTPESIKAWTSVAGNFLKDAKDQKEWTAGLEALRQQRGVPKMVLNKFDTVFDPKTSAQKAGNMTMTQEELEGLGIRRTTEEDRKSYQNRELALRQREVTLRENEAKALKPSKEDPYFTHDMEKYRTFLQTYNKSQPKEGDINPNAKSGEDSSLHYTAPPSFDDWRKTNGRPPAVGAPGPGAAAAAPPAAGGPPPITAPPNMSAVPPGGMGGGGQPAMALGAEPIPNAAAQQPAPEPIPNVPAGGAPPAMVPLAAPAPAAAAPAPTSTAAPAAKPGKIAPPPTGHVSIVDVGPGDFRIHTADNKWIKFPSADARAKALAKAGFTEPAQK